MRDPRRVHDRAEIRIDRVLGIWLTLGGVVAMGLVFAAGVMVGRGQARAGGGAAAPADALAKLDQEHELHDELTFYSRLTDGEPTRPRVEVAKANGDAVRPSIAVVPRPAEVPSEGPRHAPVGPAGEKVEGQASASGGLGAGPARAGEFTVQVSSFQTQEEANAYAAALERKGYKPFIVSAAIPGKGTWYRVRLGAFVNEEQAQVAKVQLASSDIPAWVLRAE